MSLDVSAIKSNIRLSVKKFLIDNIETSSSKTIFFDRPFTLPGIEGLEEWVTVKFGIIKRGGLSTLIFEIALATRNDHEGDALTSLSDIVFGYITDNTMPDGKRRISLYDTSLTTWYEFDKLIIKEINESEEIDAVDGTKYLILTCITNWVSKS